ncbi:MAG TPA: LCP family protein [Candidatus Limnocylindria bacterium]|nr:LCP family protein [Candidatus Limnocylindria bacterium]
MSAPEQFALRLLVPAFALALIGLIAVHAIWRVLAIIDASVVAGRRSARRPGAGRALVVLLLSAITIGAHGAAGLWIQSYSTAGEVIFRPSPDGGDPPTVPLPEEGPINVLFIGVDWMPGRDHGLTDSLILASFQRESDRLSMISVPRDTGRVPFYLGGTYNARINSLVGSARRDPERFPDGPIGTLTNEIGYIVGVPVHYFMLVNMAGFAEAVDMVGGIDFRLENDIRDDHHKFYLEAGRHHLNGRQALMVARSRFGPNNNDWQRARRQQQLLRALMSKAKDPAVLIRAPQLVEKLGEVTRTNAPVDQLPQLLDLLARANDSSTDHYVLSPNKFASRIPPAEVGGRYMTQLRMDKVAELSIELFGQYSRYHPGASGQP